ncbi:MAG TPA: metal ABC transporter ATP-binding protein [Erysipelothrix sp.]
MIKVENLYVSYYGNEVVTNVSFEFNEGSLIGIIGPNGAGKSTMIKAILGLIPKDQGKITVFGDDIKKSRSKIAYVPQRNDLDWDFPINVFDTVLMGTYPNLGLFKKPKEAEKNLAKESLIRVGMWDYRDQQIGELSGGQQQRVFLARALAQKAELFFLDEPFVGIDVASEERIVSVLKELRDEGKTVFVVHHDLSKVETYFDELILINKELIDAGSVKDVFVFDKMDKAYASNFGIPVLREAN